MLQEPTFDELRQVTLPTLLQFIQEIHPSLHEEYLRLFYWLQRLHKYHNYEVKEYDLFYAQFMVTHIHSIFIDYQNGNQAAAAEINRIKHNLDSFKSRMRPMRGVILT